MLSISLMFCIIKGIHGRSEIRRNSYKWKELAKVTLDEGGSSDKNIEEFAAKLICEEYRRVQRFSRVKGSICMFSCCKICCRNQPNKLWIKIFCKFWFVFVMRRRSCTEVTINRAFIRFDIALLMFRNPNKALILSNMYRY
jgi:hypothetical protein